jgi:hypothetical protein
MLMQALAHVRTTSYTLLKVQVDGIWYLDGKKHEDLLVRNAVCQVFIEGGVAANSSSNSSAVVKKEEETDSEPKATDTSAAATAADADADDDVEEVRPTATSQSYNES